MRPIGRPETTQVVRTAPGGAQADVGRPPARRGTALLACLPLAVVTMGALAARPIADDYVLLGVLRTSDGVFSAFWYWMSQWSAFYTMYALLTLGSVIEHSVDPVVFYPACSLLLLALLWFVARTLTRVWQGTTDVRVPGATALLVGAVLGGLFNLRAPTDPVLFGALYWNTAFFPHVVPVLLTPLVILAAVRVSARAGRPASRWGWVAVFFLAGLLLAGFAFAETGIAVLAVAVSGWALRRTTGRDAMRVLPVLVATAGGLVTGAVLVLKAFPGTGVRQAEYAGGGIHSQQGLVDVTAYVLSTVQHNATRTVLSPGLVIGLLVGFWLRWSSGQGPADHRERSLVKTWTTAMGVLAAGSWAVIAAGEVASYASWWHLFPIWMELPVLGCLLGWAWHARASSPSPRLRRLLPVTLALSMLWSTVLAGFAANAAWARQPVVDANIRAAEAVRAGRTPPPLMWQSVSVADILDPQTEPGHWINRAVARWTGLDPRQISVVPRSGPPASPPLFDLVP